MSAFSIIEMSSKEIEWQKQKQAYFIVKSVEMNLENGWGSARRVSNGTHLLKNR